MSAFKQPVDDQAMPASFTQWLAENPPPDLATLLLRYGSYSAIPSEAWAEHDAAMTAWREQYRRRHLFFRRVR